MEHDQLRVTVAERAEALALLSQHFDAGRLPSFEYEDRRGRANDASLRSDLDRLFEDLPALEGAHRHESDEPALTPARRPYGPFGRCVGSGAAYSWVPLLATALFFFTQQWVWFLLIPAAGFIANGSRHASARCDTRNGAPSVRS